MWEKDKPIFKDKEIYPKSSNNPRGRPLWCKHVPKKLPLKYKSGLFGKNYADSDNPDKINELYNMTDNKFGFTIDGEPDTTQRDIVEKLKKVQESRIKQI